MLVFRVSLSALQPSAPMSLPEGSVRKIVHRARRG